MNLLLNTFTNQAKEDTQQNFEIEARTAIYICTAIYIYTHANTNECMHEYTHQANQEPQETLEIEARTAIHIYTRKF